MQPIHLCELLWLKKKFDPDFFDRKYLADLWLGERLPDIKQPKSGKWARAKLTKKEN